MWDGIHLGNGVVDAVLGWMRLWVVDGSLYWLLVGGLWFRVRVVDAKLVSLLQVRVVDGGSLMRIRCGCGLGLLVGWGVVGACSVIG